jgi:glycerophosphoryl diester phosphodiesterase
MIKRSNINILIAIFCMAISSCSSSRLNSSGLPAFDKEGHRGARGLMPENTIPAMLKAVDLGATTLEMDICFTKDNEAIVSHEPFFNHDITTKPDGSFIKEKEEKQYNIYKMTYAEVKRYDVGMKPHPLFPEQQKIAVYKPRLADLVDSVEKYTTEKKARKVLYNIETKTMPATDNLFHPAPAAFVDMLMQVINEKGIADRVIIQSFDIRTLQYLHQKYPSIKTSLLAEADNTNSFRKQINDLGFTPTIYSPELALVNEALVKDCHSRKMKIIPWTVNDKGEIARLRSLKVDGIITDYPNLFNE